MKKKILFALAAVVALVVCAQSVIMRIELKDGTVRYVDTESVDEFNIISLDKIPESQSERYFTEVLYDSTAWYHEGYWNDLDAKVKVSQKYIANDPGDFTYTIEGLRGKSRPITVISRDGSSNIDVPCQYTGCDDPVYGPIWVTDEQTYFTEIVKQSAGVYRASQFGSDGFSLYLYYYAPDSVSGSKFAAASTEFIPDPTHATCNKYETFGFENGKKVRNCNFVKMGRHVHSVRVAWENLPDKEYETINASNIRLDERLKSGAYNELTFGNGKTVTLPVPEDSSHPYTAMVYRTYDKYGNRIDSGSSILEYEDDAFGYGNYSSSFFGDRNGLTMTMTTDSANVNHKTFTIKNWGTMNALELKIECPDITDVDMDGYVKVNVLPSYAHEMSDGEKVMCEEIHTWLTSRGFGHLVNDYSSSCYMPSAGTFNLAVVYYPERDSTSTSYYTMGNDGFQLKGFPDYTIGIGYEGKVSDPGGKNVVGVSLYPSSDVVKVRACLVEGKDQEVGIAKIIANDPDVLEFDAISTISLRFALDNNDWHTVVYAALDANGGIKYTGGYSFKETLDDDWKDLGYCEFRDGWIMPGVENGSGQLNNADYIYPVPVRVNKKDDGLYQLVSPWGTDYVLSSHNLCTEERNIEFRIEDGMPLIVPQKSGYQFISFDAELVIGNLEGYYYQSGYSIENIRQMLDESSQSTYEDGVITIPVPVFAHWETGEFGYRWNNYQPSQIFMPDVSEEAKSRIKATNIARPQISGALQMVGVPVRSMTMPLRDLRDL